MSERDYLERTIATVRNHRDADNCWPQWANIFADEIERLWAEIQTAMESLREFNHVEGEPISEVAAVAASAHGFTRHRAETAERERDRLAEQVATLREVEHYARKFEREYQASLGSAWTVQQKQILDEAQLELRTALAATEEQAE